MHRSVFHGAATVLLWALLLGGAVHAQDPGPGKVAAREDLALVTKCVPDDSAYLFAVNVERLLEHPAVKQLYAPRLQQFQRNYSWTRDMGIDPAQDITWLVLAGSEVHFELIFAGSEPILWGDTIWIVHGRFNEKHIHARLRDFERRNVCKRHSAGGPSGGAYHEFKNTKGRPLFFALIGKSTCVLSGSDRQVSQAVRKGEGDETTALQAPPLKAALAQIDTRQVAWTAFLGKAWKTPVLKPDAEKAMGLVSLRGGVSLGKDVKLEVIGDWKSPELMQKFESRLETNVLAVKGNLIRASKGANALGPLLGLLNKALDGKQAAVAGTTITLSGQAPVVLGSSWVPTDTTKLYRRVMRSTVWVVDRKGSMGTGTLIDKEQRLVLTACHVVDKTYYPNLFFPIYRDDDLVTERARYDEQRQKNKGIRGEVVAWDYSRDLAVIKLASLPDDVDALPLADKVPVPAQVVHSVGNPNVGALWVYTRGTVRVVGVIEIPIENPKYRIKARTILTDSPINPGDSGGPLVNDQGELLGVTCAVSRATHRTATFISTTEVKAFLEENKKKISP